MKALITGITGNLGQALENHLVLNNWKVTGLARSVPVDFEGIHKTELRAVDLTDYEKVLSFCGKQTDGFDLVVMAHGVQRGVELGQDDFIGWYKRIVDGNLTGAVILTDVMIGSRLLNEGALIVYCGSIQATQPRSGRGPYAIAKAGLEALTRIVAVEQGPKVRAVGMRLGQLSETMRGITFTDEQRAAIQSRTVLEWPTPEDIARFCLGLYNQPAMSGNIIDIDSSHHLRVWP